MMADLRHCKNTERLDYLLDKFKLNPNIETKTMSLGEKRKLAIVAAFMNDPDVLILDEPTSGLDPVMQQNFINFIKEEKKRGKTILLSSHLFNEVEATCDRIAIIKDGRIVSTFETNLIKHNENKSYEVFFEDKAEYDRFLKTLPKAKLKMESIEKYGVKNKDDEKLKVEIACRDESINKIVEILSDFKIKSFKEIKFTLEDYFMQFYREDKDFGGVKWKKKKK